MLDNVILAGVCRKLAHLHPTSVVAYDLQSIRIAIVTDNDEVVLLRVLFAIEIVNRLVAKLEILLVHPSLDLINAIAHLVHLLFDGVQLGG